MYLPTCHDDSPLLDIFVDQIQNNKELYHLISECITKYLLYNCRYYQSEERICETLISYFLPPQLEQKIDLYFLPDNHFIMKQYEQMRDSLLSDDYVYIPLFQKYLLMQITYGVKNNDMPHYGKTVVNHLKSMFLSELKSYYKDKASKQEKIDLSFKAKMLTSMALNPFANLFNVQDRFTYGYGFLLSDVDYRLFDIYGFKGTLNLLDSLWGREHGYNSEIEVKNILESGGKKYICKTREQLEKEKKLIEVENENFLNRITDIS